MKVPSSGGPEPVRPRAHPVIAGPRVITAVIIYGYQSDNLLTYAILSLTVLGVLGILFLTLYLPSKN